MITSGVDIIQISRVERLIEDKRNPFLNRVFTEKEIDYINSQGNNSKTIAGLYASKEAVSKALGTGIGQVSWKDMEVTHNDKGKPLVNLSPKLDKLLVSLGINRFDLSISHDGDYAIAFVIGYDHK